MNTPELWASFLIQILLRGAGWLLFIALVSLLVSRASAARRALVWQMAFAGLVLLPVTLLVLPPVPIAGSASLRFARQGAVNMAFLFPKPEDGEAISMADPHMRPATTNKEVMRATPAIPGAAFVPVPSAPALPPSASPMGQISPNSPNARLAPASSDNGISPPKLGVGGRRDATPPKLGAGGRPVRLADWSRPLLLAWSAGAAWCLLSLVRSVFALRHLGRCSVAPPAELDAEMRQLAGRLGRPSAVALRIASAEGAGLHAPITWGWIRPVVMLPQACAEGPLEARRAALLHELSHIRRGDWAWQIAAQIVCAVMWCVPLAWHAARRLRQETELACDDCVLANGVSAPAYASQILEIARGMKSRAARLPAGALTMARPPLAQSRIHAILDPRRPRHSAGRRLLVWAALLPALCVPILSLRAAVADLRSKGPLTLFQPESTLPRASPMEDLFLPLARASTPRVPDAAAGVPSVGEPQLHTALPDRFRAATLSTPHAALKSGAEPADTKIPAGEREAGASASATDRPPKGAVVHWGRTENGLQVGLTIKSNQRTFEIGETVKMDLYWRNATNRPIRLTYAWYSRHDFVPDLETAAGARVEVANAFIDIMSIVTAATLKPGETIWAAEPHLLLVREKRPGIETMAMVKPGRHRIRVANNGALNGGKTGANAAPNWTWQQSGWADFEVLPDEPDVKSARAAMTTPDSKATAAKVGEDGETRTIAWGPTVDGLQAGLRLEEPRTTFAPGEPIWQEVYLRNRSDKEVIVSASGGYEEQGAPVITGGKGVKVKVLRYFGMGAMFVVTRSVRPGELACVGRFAVRFRDPSRNPEELHEVAPGISSIAEGGALALAGAGSYRLRQEILPFTADDKRPAKTFATGSIPIRIADIPGIAVLMDRNKIPDLSTAPIAWGPEQSGLRAGLLLLENKSRYYVGERVRLVVVLRNVSKQPISFRHETSFAFLDAPYLLDARGGKQTVKRASEPEWKALSGIKMTGVTFDMTSAPSADGPSRLRESDIGPGKATIGYYLTAFVVPPKWSDGRATPGRYRVIQPVRLGLAAGDLLDTTLEAGPLNLEIQDPDR